MEKGKRVMAIGGGEGSEEWHLVFAARGLTAEILNEFHGAYDLDWIVVKKDGVEVERYNPIHVQYIQWEK